MVCGADLMMFGFNLSEFVACSVGASRE